MTAQNSIKPYINWDNIKNPIYEHKDWCVKDAAMAYDKGWFYLYFSAFFYDSGKERSHLVSVRTRDFIRYSEPLFIWSGMEKGWEGLASPDIVKYEGTYYLTYNTWGDKPGKPNQLFYATSKDLKKWDTYKPLAQNVTKGLRSIDAALAFDNKKIYLVFKMGQVSQIAVADSIESYDWKLIGRPLGKIWFENGQFIHIDSCWYLLSTQKRHEPYLAKMSDNIKSINDWLKYETPEKCVVPVESFNSDESSNAASIYDFRSDNGFFYLLYAGRTEGLSHAGRGDNKLGLARSKDKITWEIP